MSPTGSTVSPAAPAAGALPSTARWVIPVALGLIAIQLAVRSWLVVRGNFYWDDLIIIGRASDGSIFSWDFLMHDHDGHLMPAAFLVAGITTEIAPLNWEVPAITLVVGQLLASLAVLRLLIVIVGRYRPAVLVPFAFYLFTPMTVPAYNWWAAGLNTLPLQIGMAVVAADVVLLCRGGVDRRRVIIRSLVVFVVALAFFEKSVLILPVAAATAFLWCLLAEERGARAALLSAWRAARELWIALVTITAVWAVGYLTLTSATAGEHSISQTIALVWRSINNGLVPASVGGPWEWERWIPSPPMGFSSWWLIAAGWLVVIGGIGYALYSRRRSGWVIGAVIGYVAVLQLPLLWSRTSENTALELAQTLRYLPDSALIIAVGAALILAAPRRMQASEISGVGSRWVRPVAVVATLAFIASSLVSTVRFSDEWRNDPTANYLSNARTSLAAAKDTPMFDHPLPLLVLLPVAYPYNQVSKVFGGLSERPEFGEWTDKLQVLDDNGNLAPAEVTQRRTTEAGDGACDRPEVTGPVSIGLDGPLLEWLWTVALPYCANTDGELVVGLAGGEPVTVPVRAGLHSVYVQLSGAGTELQVRPRTPGLALHIGSGRIGEVVRVP